MKYEIRYRIDMYRVRALCIRENWYTCGDNNAYEHMLLEMCEGEDLEALEEIAEDIADHSDLETLREKYDADPEETILEYLLNECCWMMPTRDVSRYEIPELVPENVEALLEFLKVRR